MPSLALHVVDEYERSGKLSDGFHEIPAWQFEIWFKDLSAICPLRLSGVSTERRPCNGLNIEANFFPSPRCCEQSPDGRGLAWLYSGGSVAAYGMCSITSCPRTKQQPTTQPHTQEV